MFSSRKNGELVLILDVQSSIVRSTVVHFKPETLPLVTHTGKFQIPFKAETDSSYLVKMAMQGVEETITAALKDIHDRVEVDPAFPKKISAVHYVLSSPWIISQAKTLSLNFEKATAVSKAYIMGMVWEQRQRLAAEHAGDLHVIEEKVFDVRLNGYSVASWESKSTSQLEVSFLVSLAGNSMVQRFIQATECIVHKDAVHFHSSLFLQHIGITKTMPSNSDYALIHAHGELTDVAFVRSHASTFFGSFPFGIHTVIRSIATKNNIDIQSAESILTMASDDALDPTHAAPESQNLETLSKDWIEQFNRLITSDPSTGMVPRHIIISAHAHEDFFLKCLVRAYPRALLDLLNIEAILSHVAFDQQTDRLRLTGLYVAAIHSL